MKQDNSMLGLLDALEQQLLAAQLWDTVPPSPEQLASEQPFAIDTLKPEQWLQWVFIPRMKAMLAAGQSLPTGFSMVGYFEQSWQAEARYAEIITLIAQIDQQVA